jgi:TolB-like protein/Tfp pilus assembly protein PilF
VDFDPQQDAIVRVQAHEIRRALKEYYETDGKDDRVRIELPAGSYVPVFSRVVPAALQPSLEAGRGVRFYRTLTAILLLACAALLALGFNLGGLRDRLRPRAKAPAGRIMLAVLPFENLSRDPEQEYFSDGLTGEMITQLGRLHPDRLGVIARTSAMQYKKTSKRVDQIGRELNVDYILEGSVRRAGDRVRVAAELIQVHDQTHLWADSYERDLRDVLSLQSDVAASVARQVQLQLTAQQLRLAAGRTVHPEAYEAYLKGRHHSYRATREGLLKGIEYYEQAIQKDPEYALAYAALAHTHFLLIVQEYLPIGDRLERARAAARRGLELDPTLAEAHIYFADEKFYLDWDWAGGEAGYRRAAELDPGSADAVLHHALCLNALGRFQEAFAVMERACQLDPLSPWVNGAHINLLHDAHQDDQAIEQSRRTIELDPNDAGNYLRLGGVYEEQGRQEEAGAAYLKALSLPGASPQQVQACRDAYKAEGLRGYWRRRLEYLKATAEPEHVSPVTFANVNVRLGQKDQALKWLEQAYQERSPQLAWLKVARMWDPLRSDPRFQDLLRRMNFPP